MWPGELPPSPDLWGAAAFIYHLGSICSSVKYHGREETQCGHLTFLYECWLLYSLPGMKQIQGGGVSKGLSKGVTRWVPG